MSIAALIVGWALAWAAGIALLAALRRTTATELREGDVSFVVGCGWFVGQYLVTLWMRGLALVGVPFSIISIGAPLALFIPLATLVAAPSARRAIAAVRGFFASRAASFKQLPKAQRVLCLALFAWLALRLLLLLMEVVQRPLYPWDAWTQWSTKARVFYELRTIVPFVGASEWFASSGGVYFDAAPHYPATVPLTQVWSATLLGAWNDSLINLPWWLTAVAFGLTLYGFLRLQRMSTLFALTGAWLALSLPMFDTHVALAGYADLAMSTYFTLTVLVALRFVETRAIADLAVAMLLASACIVIKNPGKIWLLTMVPGLAAALFPRIGTRFAAGCFAAAAFVAIALTQRGVTILGYHLQLDYDMPWRGLLDAWFAYANWHLLFFGAIVVALVARRHLLSPALRPLTITIAAGVAFLLFGFAFTNARLWVEDQSTVNRATLHLAPLIVVWMLLAFRAWSAAESRPVEASVPVSA